MKNKWWLTSRTTQNTTWKHKNFTIFPVTHREIDAEKRRFQPAKRQKMTNFFMTLEFKILRLFMKNKWWLTSRTTKNKTSKYKNFTIFPLILRVIDVEKSRCQPAKTQKMTNFSWRCNSKFWGYLWTTSDGSHSEPHKTRLRNIKISPFFSFSQRIGCWENAFSASENAENDQFFHDVGIQNFEVI
jgi:hypothetical protein